MTDAPHHPAPRSRDAEHDLTAVVADLQDQVTDLTATLETHQRLFERLRRDGLLPSDDDGARP